MVPGFGQPMQLFRGDVERFGGLAVYVHDRFSAYRQRNYERGCCELIVIRICHIFFVFVVYRNPDPSDKILTFYCSS